MKRTYTVKEWLIEAKNKINNVGKVSPYFGIWLIADIIEFMGKCLSNDNFRSDDNSRKHFNDAIASLSAFADYRQYDNLYKKLRCGLTHGMRPGGKFEICKDGQNSHTPNNECISFEQLNSDFSKAVDELIHDNNSRTVKRLNMPYVIINDNNGNPRTGATIDEQYRSVSK